MFLSPNPENRPPELSFPSISVFSRVRLCLSSCFYSKHIGEKFPLSISPEFPGGEKGVQTNACSFLPASPQFGSFSSECVKALVPRCFLRYDNSIRKK